MIIKNTEIDGVKIVVGNRFSDSRGYFQETYRDNIYSSLLEDGQKFVQENESCSKAGTFRGIHFQKMPYSQAKLVRVVKGAVIDYAVDLRKDSPTYLKWTSVMLSEENNTQFFLPKWCGHAFVSLEDNTVFCYKCTNYYNKESECGIRYDDPAVNLKLPDDMQTNLIFSDKDMLHPLITDNTDFGF